MWTNLCSFNARCVQSGIFDVYGDACGHPVDEIAEGLEQDHPLGVMQDCFITIALQYIFLAGPKIYQELVEKPAEGSEAKAIGCAKWNRWTERLDKVAEHRGQKSELGRAARGAHDKMTLLHGPTVIEAGEPLSACAVLLLIGLAIMWMMLKFYISPTPHVTQLPHGESE